MKPLTWHMGHFQKYVLSMRHLPLPVIYFAFTNLT